MKFWITLSCLSLYMIPVVWAASLEDRLQSAQDLLDSGNATAALEAYQELQVDYPEEKIALFGSGCAQYLQASHQFDLGEIETARSSLQGAKSAFNRLNETNESALSADAAFNSANCVALQAKIQLPPQNAPVQKKDYEKAVAAMQGAVNAYKGVLRQYPDHPQSQQNLDHSRYLLKELLRNPPEEQEPPEGIAVFDQVGTELPKAEAANEDGSNVLELIWKRGDES